MNSYYIQIFLDVAFISGLIPLNYQSEARILTFQMDMSDARGFNF